jgi:hypothetical protein
MTKVRVGRKFIAFLLCLTALIVLGLLGKCDSGTATAIITLYAAYVTGNVTQKATSKEQNDER